MECDICLMEWDSKVRIPRLLSCGHTFCESCLVSIFHKAKSKNIPFFCPTCKAEQTFQSEEDLLSLIKNFNLLRIVEKIENRKTIVPSQISSSDKDTSPNVSKLNKPDTGASVVEKSAINEQFTDQKCKKHNLSLYLYVPGTNMLLCDSCVKETSLKAYPLPSVKNILIQLMRDFRKKVEYSANRICLLNSEIERLMEFFASYQDEFMKVNKQKLDSLFDYFHKIVQYNYNNSLHILNQCKKEQVDQVSMKMDELSNLQQQLKELETDVLVAYRDGDKEILKNNEKLTKIMNKLNYFLNYELELNLLTMRIGLKDEAKSNLMNMIQDSYFVDVEFAQIKGGLMTFYLESPTIQHILQKDKYWICVCGESNNYVNTSLCVNCGLLRKLESFQNLLINPKNTNMAEIEQLILRRKEECRVFQEKLKGNLENEDKLMAIETEWFLNWKCFVTNDLSEKFLSNQKKKISQNINIGVLQPGPINNFPLFEKGVKEFNEKSLRKGLKKNEDFIFVNKELWKFLIDNYGGGPEIILGKNEDIYSSSITLIPEDLFYHKIPKKQVNYESDITSRENINESIVTNNFDQKYDPKLDVTSNEKDFIHQTYLNCTNYNENETFYNASKFEETFHLYGNSDSDNGKTLTLEPTKGVILKVTQKNEKKEPQFSDKLKTILKLK